MSEWVEGRSKERKGKIRTKERNIVCLPRKSAVCYNVNCMSVLDITYLPLLLEEVHA